jgi:hypothetical protein
VLCAFLQESWCNKRRPCLESKNAFLDVVPVLLLGCVVADSPKFVCTFSVPTVSYKVSVLSKNGLWNVLLAAVQLHFHLVPVLNLAELSKEAWVVMPYQMLNGHCHFGGITHL